MFSLKNVPVKYNIVRKSSKIACFGIDKRKSDFTIKKNKENISPHDLDNKWNSLYIERRISTRCIKKRRVIKEAESKQSQLVLPDDSNFKQMITFIQDVKEIVSPSQNSGLESLNTRYSSTRKSESGIECKNDFEKSYRTEFAKPKLMALEFSKSLKAFDHFINKEFDFHEIRSKLNISNEEEMFLSSNLKGKTIEQMFKLSIYDPLQ